ncbi:DUF2093 domain-containing protein [uncultured Brevundimonas sp.]|uniref:DUF2093 domain-containing protein n=1 Tax=uncultured Brevundimonas sp. TaxID=213418 RepID=UPI00261AEF9B|nr:DUF2093 domain-containing protein [uncultured Brevundimonas sp.]
MSGTEAQLVYECGDYQVLKPGDFVRCAVTGQAVPLDALNYWSAELQEAYATPDIMISRLRELKRL